MAYIGTEPKDVRSFGRAKFDYTATQGQTAFTGADDDGKTLGFTDGQIEVFVNGILMDDSDFSTSNGNTVTLASAANLNDIISIVAMQTDIPNSDYVPISGGTFTGAVTASNGLTVDDSAATPLTVDRATNDGAIIDVQKDGTSVGSIGTYGGDMTVGTGDTRVRFIDSLDCVVPVSDAVGTSRDAAVDLGYSSIRYKDLYLSGGVYLGGTGASNHLDDYEEGTWSPIITDLSGNGATMTVSNGKYVKVGSLVTAHFSCTISSKGSMTGNYAMIRTLPFTHAGSNAGSGMINRYANLSTGFSSLGMELGGGVASYGWFTGMSGTNGTADGYLSVSQINSNFFVQGTVVYTIV